MILDALGRHLLEGVRRGYITLEMALPFLRRGRGEFVAPRGTAQPDPDFERGFTRPPWEGGGEAREPRLLPMPVRPHWPGRPRPRWDVPSLPWDEDRPGYRLINYRKSSNPAPKQGFYDKESGEGVADPAQLATLQGQLERGLWDKDAPDGSYFDPRVQFDPGDVPAPGDWYVEWGTGILKKGSDPSAPYIEQKAPDLLEGDAGLMKPPPIEAPSQPGGGVRPNPPPRRTRAPQEPPPQARPPQRPAAPPAAEAWGEPDSLLSPEPPPPRAPMPSLGPPHGYPPAYGAGPRGPIRLGEGWRGRSNAPPGIPQHLVDGVERAMEARDRERERERAFAPPSVLETLGELAKRIGTPSLGGVPSRNPAIRAAQAGFIEEAQRRMGQAGEGLSSAFSTLARDFASRRDEAAGVVVDGFTRPLDMSDTVSVMGITPRTAQIVSGLAGYFFSPIGTVGDQVVGRPVANAANAVNRKFRLMPGYEADYQAITDAGLSAIPLVGEANGARLSSATTAKLGEFGTPPRLPTPPRAKGSSGVDGEGGRRVLSLRLRYMGRTPDKYSRAGAEVVARMRSEGQIIGEGPLLRGNPNRLKLIDKDGAFKEIDSTIDMAHKTDAVTWWNDIGRFFGAKSPEVRRFMLNSKNYILQPQSVNRSAGARLGQTYLPPARPATSTYGGRR